jgi:hypothetical protein
MQALHPVKAGYVQPEGFEKLSTLETIHPALYDRIHRALIESNIGGMTQWVKYEGDVLNGKGTIKIVYMYGVTRQRQFQVVNGVIKIMGRSLDMRKLMRTWPDVIGGTPLLKGC